MQACRSVSYSLENANVLGITYVLGIVAAAFCLGPTPMGAAQPPRAEQADFDGASLPLNRTDARGIKRVRESIAKGEYSSAIRFLDAVLERDEDSFLRMGNSGEFVGLKETAWQIIGDLPPEGRQAYETTFGPVARRLLKQSVIEGNYDGLRRLTRRYFHTPAGYEAALLLAQHEADLGRHLSAALVYQELLDTPAAAARFQPQLSLQAALSWTALGSRDRSRQLLLALRGANFRSVRVDEKDVQLDLSSPDFWDELLKHTGVPISKDGAPERQWLTSGGNPQRNGQSVGGLPHMRVDWQVRLLAHPLLESAFQEISADRLRRHQPLIPAASPLAVSNYLITRSAHNLIAIDFTTGKRVWQSQPQKFPAFEQLIGGENTEDHQAGLAPASAFAQRIWGDYLYNTISSDGQRVYVIRDLKVPMSSRYEPWRVRILPEASADAFSAGTNRLCAYDLETQGKLVWEVDGAASRDELKGAFFLGAPLAVGQSLYCLSENNSERAIYLVALDRLTGKLQWRQQLANLETGILIDTNRRLQAAIPSYDEGILVCPTGVGVVVGIDLAKNALAWAYRYETNESFPRRKGKVRAGGPANQWLDAAVTLAQGRVVLTPPESSDMHCIDLATGVLVWKNEREQGVHVAGIDGNNILIVGQDKISAIRLEDGKPAWKKTSLPFPSGSVPTGRGFVSKGKYFFPLSTAEVVSVDTASGEYVSRVVSREGRPLGNLVCHQGAVVSQSGDLIDRFGQIEVLRDASERRLKKNPEDHDSLRTLGEMAFNDNQLTQAVEWLKKANSIEPNDLQIREVLSECLQAALDEDFASFRHLLPLLDEIQGPSDKDQLTLLRLQAQGLLDIGDVLGAFDICRNMAEKADADESLLQLGRYHQVGLRRWVRAQVAAVWAKADDSQRAQITDQLEEAMAQLATENSAARVEQFFQCFAGLRICEPLAMQIAVEHLDKSRLLAAQQILVHLANSTNAAIRGEAVARCSRMLHRVNLPHLAVSFDERLNTTLATVACLDGKTGKQCLREWGLGKPGHQRSGLEPGEPEPGAGSYAYRGVNWPYGKVEVSRRPSTKRARKQGKRPTFLEVQLEHSDDVLGGGNVFLGHINREVLVQDSFGREVFRTTLQQPSSRQMYGSNSAYGASKGNLLLISSGQHILAFNTLPAGERGAPQLLWRKQAVSNLDNRDEYIVRRAHRGSERPGSRRPRRAERDGKWIGVIGPLTHDSCVLQDQSRLVCVDPLTGEIRWQRSDVPAGCDLFGDEQFVFAVERAARKAFVFSTVDGRRLSETEVPVWRERLTTRGRHVICWRRLANRDFELSSIDAASEKVIWKRVFGKSSRVDIARSRFVAVADPQGNCVVIDADSGKTLLEEPIQKSAGIQELHLLAGVDNFLLAVELPQGSSRSRLKVIPFNQSDYVQMDGQIYVFNRATGKPEFVRPATVKQQVLPLSQPVDLPVVAFAGHLPRQTNSGGKNFMRLLVLEKSSGRQLFSQDDLPPSNNYFALRAGKSSPHEVVVEMLELDIHFAFTGRMRPPEPPAMHEVSLKQGGNQGLLGIGQKMFGGD